MSKEKSHELQGLFYPKNLVVVGATPKGFGYGGNGFIEGAMSLNFSGKIYPVNPRAETILGLTTYRSVRDIPAEIDLVIFAVPHTSAVSVMKDCADKGVKFAHIFTAGFSETGYKKNADIEKELIGLAKKGGVRVVGPNCMGLYCPEGGLAWDKNFPKEPGNVGFVSQSGQLAGQFTNTAGRNGLRFSKVISFGNASDIKSHDFLNYFAQDENTKIIGSYIEGLNDGAEFFEEAKKITAKKPIVVWKGGQTEGGSRAAQSHTASIAGSIHIWRSICRQAGIISVNSMEELIATIAALQRIPLPNGLKVAILGGAGGGSVTMTDAAERENLQVPQLSDETISSLEEFVPLSGNIIKNPLDVMGALFWTRSGSSSGDNFIKIFKLLRDDPNIDALIFTQRIGMFFDRGGRALMDFIVNKTCDGIKLMEKPAFLILDPSNTLDEEAVRKDTQEKYNRAGITTFPSFEIAARVLYNMNQYKRYLASRI